jgi:uncharacterized membrane protein YphA (DoxX/SURF4 family)
VEILSAPLAVAAVVLVVAGALKVVDPVPAVGALRQLGLPAGDVSVRVVAAAEVAIGAAALVLAGPVPAALVAASYLAFTGVVVAALRAGTMISSCGCFGRDDTPPDASHVVVNVVLASVAAGAATSGSPNPWDAIAGTGAAEGVLAAGLVALGSWMVVLVYTALPQAAAAARTSSEARAERARGTRSTRASVAFRSSVARPETG